MKFKGGDIVRYSYDGFNYTIELVEFNGQDDWLCKFIASHGPKNHWYGIGDTSRFPESNMRHLTPLEQLL